MTDLGVMMGIIMIMAQLWKKMGLRTDLIPFLNLVVALALTLIPLTELDLVDRIQQGLIIGLAASGVYDCYMGLKEDK